MPFFGSDWRAPGDKWIRTEFGWKRLSDIHATFQRQFGKVASSVMAPASAAVKRGTAMLRSHNGSPGTSTRSSSRESSRTNSPERAKRIHGTFHATYDEQRLQRLQLALAQRCISARGSSRESNQYSTISDAVSKLNFSQDLLDINCYPFICKVMEILFEDHYWTLSGSMQTTLQRLTSAAKDAAIESRQQIGHILSLMDKQILTLEKGRAKVVTGFSTSRLDAKIKSLLSYRAQLLAELQKGGGIEEVELPYLPGDCWRHIIGLLDRPQDLLNLRCVNRTLCYLASECSVWKSLTKYHYGEHIPGRNSKAMDTFRNMYLSSGRELKVYVSYAVVLCKVCDCVYWRDYGHPCTASVHRPAEPLTDTGNLWPVPTGLTAQQFVHLFQC